MSDMIAEGYYAAQATGNGGLGETEGGKEQLGLEFRIEEDGPYKGRTIWAYLYFTDKTLERTHESLGYCGFHGTPEDLENSARLKAAGITKNKVSLVIKHETYKDETQAKVAFINAFGAAGGIKTKLDPVKTKMFASRLAGAWANLNKGYQQVGGGMPFPNDDKPPV